MPKGWAGVFRRRWAIILAALVVGGAALVGIRVWGGSGGTDLQNALRLAPGDAARYVWTDWAGVRRRLGAHLDAGSTGAQVDAFLSKGYDADLTSNSALTDSAGLLQASYGWSPATLDWELLSESTTGEVVIGHLPDSLSVDDLQSHLKKLGFLAPAQGKDVWDGSGVDWSKAATGGTGDVEVPVIDYVAFDPDRHLVISGDNGGYVQHALDTLGDSSLPAGISQVAGAVGEPLSAAIYSGDYACSKLAMSQADPQDQQAAAELIQQAGEVNPMDGFAMATQPGGDVRVAMAFESHEQAVTNADTRSRLAAGPAPGQGGSFSDRFRLGQVAADGNVVTMQLHPVAGAMVMSDLSTGPLLFATC